MAHPVGVTGIAATNLTIDDHPPHTHRVEDTVQVDLDEGVEEEYELIQTDVNPCTGPPKDETCSVNITLDHTVNETPHTHATPLLFHVGSTSPDNDLVHDTIDTVPRHKQLHFIERVNNGLMA